jgi:hypothetical protein
VRTTSTGQATASPSQPVPAWVRAAAYAVPLCVLPSALWRLWKLATGLPPGCQQLMRAWEPWYIAALSVGSFGAALLTIGLVRPWGEVVPRRVPFLGGRTVPVGAAVIAAAAGASVIFAVYAYALLNPILHLRPTPQIPGCPPPTEEPGAWVAIASYTPLLAWGPLLVVVTVAYYRRRTARGQPTGTPSGRRARSGPGSGRPSLPS